MARRGFTLIEVLVTMGIILVLGGMVLIAMRSVTGGAKTHATHIALENCKSMLSEYETVKPLTDSSQVWVWWNGTANKFVVGDPTTTTGPNLWLRPGVAGAWQSLDAPGYVKDDSAGHAARNASQAVLNTSIVMGNIAAIPANRDALLKLPQDQIFLPEWTAEVVPTSGADRFIGFTPDGTNSPSYPSGCRVRYGGNAFRCTVNGTAATPVAPAAPPAPWITDTNPVPMLRDAWNNPIIFVPATGLQVRMLNGKKAYDPADATQNFIIVSPEGTVNGNGTGSPVLTNPGRPFWASAGPDGDFSKGDDNIYSFEQ